MATSRMSFLFPLAIRMLAALAVLALGGCVVAPGYGPYGGGYYAPGYAYAPAPVVVGGGWYGGGGGWHGGGGGGGGWYHGRGW
jgi:hypothetical protein